MNLSRTPAKKNKIVVILGPTASGKTGLAVRLAARFNGEIVSADSRQVYCGMDVGTGKDLKEYKVKSLDIPYYLIDVADPKEIFDLAKYKKLAEKAIEDILKRGKLPFVVGGSGLYLQALIDNFKLTDIKADKKLRAELENLSVAELFVRLRKLNPKLAAKINQSDRGNKRRLIRYLEILSGGAKSLGERRNENRYDALILGLDWPNEALDQRIEYRLLERLEKEGLVAEVKKLHNQGVSWRRLESFGLEYKFVSRHLQGKLAFEAMAKGLFIAIRQFARRQRSWFRRWQRQGRTINWIKSEREAENLIERFKRERD